MSLQALTTIVKDWTGLLVLVCGLLAGIGFSVNPPWASSADFDKLRNQVTSIARDGTEARVTGYKTQKVLLQSNLRDAKRELNSTPNSISAQRLVEQIEEQIAELDRKLRRIDRENKDGFAQ